MQIYDEVIGILLWSVVSLPLGGTQQHLKVGLEFSHRRIVYFVDRWTKSAAILVNKTRLLHYSIDRIKQIMYNSWNISTARFHHHAINHDVIANHGGGGVCTMCRDVIGLHALSAVRLSPLIEHTGERE